MTNTIEVLAQLNQANLEPRKESVVYLMLKITGMAGKLRPAGKGYTSEVLASLGLGRILQD
jgi:hypothetical protein